MECPFCNIINKEADAYIVYESENIVAVLDIDPINEGHVLILPKIHEASIDKIPLCMLSEIMQLIQKIVAALKEIYNIDGYSIMQNGGEFCDFGHAHFHVFPRYDNDGFGWTYGNEAKNVNEEIAEGIRTQLESNL